MATQSFLSFHALLKHTSFNVFSRATLAIASGAMLSLAPGFVQVARAEAGLSLSRNGGISDRLEIQQERIISSRFSRLVPIETTGRFISDTTPPAPGQRVALFNITPGFSSEPFTKRDYSDVEGSEVIVLSPGTEHETRRFSLLPGSSAAPKQNDFRYEISDASGEILETGNFSLPVGLSRTPVATVINEDSFGYNSFGHFGGGFGSRSFRSRGFRSRGFRRGLGRGFSRGGFRH